MTKVGTINKRCHTLRCSCSCSCHKNSKECRCDDRQHAVLRRSHQQCRQGSSLSHSSSTSHPSRRVSRWCEDGGDRDGVVSAGLLQLSPVRHIFIQLQQTAACAERPSVHRHDDEKTRSHYTGVSQSAMASCHCSRSVQNSTTDIQDTRDSSANLHSRPTPAAPLVTTQVLWSQPAWNSSDENRFCTTQLHLSLPTWNSTQRHHWQLECYSNHFQKDLQNVLLHYVVGLGLFIVSRDPRACDFVNERHMGH